MLWLGVDLRADTKKTRFERDWSTCSRYAIHSRLNRQHDWDDLHDNCMGTRIFTLIMNEDILMTSKEDETNECGHDLDLLITLH